MVEHQKARLAASDEDYRRFGIERGMCRPSEDAMRTHGGRGTFEWWYTDVTFDEGPTVVLIFFTKNYFDVSGPAWPTVDFELVEKDGTRTNVFTRGKRGVCASGETEACDVVIEKNFIRYEDGSYHLHYEDHGIVYDAVMRPRMGMWRPESGHWLFGEGAEERLFAWLV
ncbi:MAG: hypothetical protein IJC51_05690, partial [Eggerthellaceae bacterium]|nr:hypothetical protein [Eggerthellaceae bacterium]